MDERRWIAAELGHDAGLFGHGIVAVADDRHLAERVAGLLNRLDPAHVKPPQKGPASVGSSCGSTSWGHSRTLAHASLEPMGIVSRVLRVVPRCELRSSLSCKRFWKRLKD